LKRERVLIIGGGVSGLAAAGFLADGFDCQLLEKERELGGYCRTVYQDGFTWDYSGHFFHFRHPWIRDHIHRRMDTTGLLAVRKVSRVYFRGSYIDHPFQFNIHQLPLTDFLCCLSDMHEAQQTMQPRYANFRDMVYGRYGRALSDMFLLPYNEKLYAISAEELDADAMGRFFPHIEIGTLLAKLAGKIVTESYNDRFTYHRRGAKAFVDAIASYVPAAVIRTGVACTRIDLGRHEAYVGDERIAFDRLIVSAPLPRVMELIGEDVPSSTLRANKVLVFNLGFDRPSLHPDHWVYYPEPKWVFFRVGHYDRILGGTRMSLYVEIALPSSVPIDVEGQRRRVLEDLSRVGVIAGHELISWHHVVLDPAYVHVSRASSAFAADACSRLEARGVFPVGRYARWTYCSIEDNILSAYQLARSWGAAREVGPAA
jgi:protoporphyrinogen oxidase